MLGLLKNQTLVIFRHTDLSSVRLLLICHEKIISIYDATQARQGYSRPMTAAAGCCVAKKTGGGE